MGTTAPTFQQLVMHNTMLLDAAYEGFGADGTGRPYQDPLGIWTIAFGTTILPDGSHVTADTPEVTREQGYEYMIFGVQSALDVIDRWVKRPLTIGQKSALGSFVYNIGPGIQGERDGFVWLADGNHSTILRMVQAGAWAAAAGQFPLWDRGGGRVLSGLENRRLGEQGVFTGANPLRNGILTTLPRFPAADILAWDNEITAAMLAHDQALAVSAAQAAPNAHDSAAAQSSAPPSNAEVATVEAQEYP